MPRRPRFVIIFDELTLDQLDFIDSKYDSLIQKSIGEQLLFDPMTETRNRKPLLRETAIGATWELRCGPNNRFRIFYDVDVQEHTVIILAIAQKDGNRLLIGSTELEL